MAGSDYGYVNPHGILFPVGHKYLGGHVSTWDVCLVVCPKCKRRNSATEAVKGACGEISCGYSQIDELDAMEEV